MKRYRIRYRAEDPGCPVFSCVLSAYNLEHLGERLVEEFEGEAWKVVSVEALSASTHRGKEIRIQM